MEKVNSKSLANQELKPQDNINTEIVQDWAELFELLIPAYIQQQEKEQEQCK
jgi:hypothetical protein